MVEMDLAKIDNIPSYEKLWQQTFDGLPEIDLFLNNAGISCKNPLSEIDYDYLIQLQNTNIITPFVATNVYLHRKEPLKKKMALSSSGLSQIPVGFSAFYPFDKHMINSLIEYQDQLIDHENNKLQVVLMGQVFSGISQYSDMKWSPDNDGKNTDMKFGFLSSKEAAYSILFYGLGNESLMVTAHPIHYLKAMPLFEWNIPIISKIWRKKRLAYIESQKKRK